MAKTLYSLILSSEVVAAIDGIAAREGVSRSALINHILAEYASLSTPEKRSKDIAQTAGQAAGNSFRASVSPGGTLTLRTVLQYKYNPAISYVVDLREEDGTIGTVYLVLRSQNQDLLRHIRQFFALWAQMEGQYLPAPPGKSSYTANTHRYGRQLRSPQSEPSGQQTGLALAEYITLLDACLQSFFKYPGNPAAAAELAEAHYRRSLPGLGLALYL
ncbi:MAG: CopG family transcriptional regulator [Oscillospiraceae bacterium]